MSLSVEEIQKKLFFFTDKRLATGKNVQTAILTNMSTIDDESIIQQNKEKLIYILHKLECLDSEGVMISDEVLETSITLFLNRYKDISLNLYEYFSKMKPIIIAILSRADREQVTYDILDTEKSTLFKKIALKEKQRQMKLGDIWQKMIGGYQNFIDLGVGDPSGLDIRSDTLKIIMELKNRTNTDNSSSKKANLDKLVRYHRDHLEYKCIYGYINADSEEKTMKGSIEINKHDTIDIYHYVGMALLDFVFGENKNKVIEFLKIIIDSFYPSELSD